MGLVYQKKGSLHGGVSQQSPEHRLDSQVEEMNNCVPTLDKGLRLRNSTAPIPVSDLEGALSQITFPAENETAFVYEYDRGVIAGRGSELAFIITKEGGLEIVDLTLSVKEGLEGQEILSGLIYKDGNGINYENDDARLYLGMLENNSDFAMTTVKDTTFIVNKNINPLMLPTYDDEDDTENPPILLSGQVQVDYSLVSGLNPETISSHGSGSFTFTPPVGVTSVDVNTYGSGGGGGGSEGGAGGDTTSDGDDGSGGQGGGAGQEITATHTIATGQEGGIYINASGSGGGSGGAGGTDCGGNGTPGSAGAVGGNVNFSVNGITVQSSAGGTSGAGGQGQGQFGTDGASSTVGSGGAFGAGEGIVGGAGGVASGGGGGGLGQGGSPSCNDGNIGPIGGAGGLGRVIINWTYALDPTSTAYLREGYVWIKRIDVVDGYAYGASLVIKNAGGVKELFRSALTSLTPDSSVTAASRLAAVINTAIVGRGSASAIGSIVKITLTNEAEELVDVDAFDTFGDTASFGWAHNVNYQTDLPPNMSSFNPIVEVGEPREPTYWLIYSEEKWREYHRPQIYTQINNKTMPHVIKIKDVEYEIGLFRKEFFVEQYDWGTRKVGDDLTNKLPSFINDDETGNVVIKDIFFFRNRLGLITQTSILTSEVGEYGNFFRTTVAALLDSDRIDAGVESTKAVNLEYAIALEDSMILFADKVQFRFSGGNILSPAQYKIQQEMSYDVNLDVRPLFMNDRVFFVARRGKFSAVYEMQISNNSGQNSSAIDLTVHCQSYVDGEVEKLTGSPVDSTLFLTSKVRLERVPNDALFRPIRNTVFMYRYNDNGSTREQSAWSKWTFNGDVLSGFAIGRNFYLLIDRTNAVAATDWIMGSGEWQMDNVWRMDYHWIMSPESLKRFKQFERLPIYPRETSGLFLDNYNTPIEGLVNLGEFVYGKQGARKLDGNLLLKMIEVRTDEDSELTLWVRDTQRDDYREVPSKYVIDRKPMLYGNSKQVKFGFKNEGSTGFRLDDVLVEANRVRRTSTK